MKTAEERAADRKGKAIAMMTAERTGFEQSNLDLGTNRPVMLVETVKLSDIKVGNRHRKDLGDVQALADSIRELGLLHPPVINSEGELIAGERRLEACRRLGWTEIPVRRLDLAEIVRGEYAENTLRKDFTPSEAVAIKKALEPLERKTARERQKATQLSGGGKLPPPGNTGKKGKTRDIVAAGVGMSGKTLEHAEVVVDSGRKDLIKEMDRNGKVDPVYRKLAGATAPAKVKATPGRSHLPQPLQALGIVVELSPADVEETIAALSIKPNAQRRRIIEKLRRAKASARKAKRGKG